MTLLGFLSLPLLAQTSGYQVGDEAMKFNLQNADGSTVSLDDPEYAKGRGAIQRQRPKDRLLHL